MAAQPAHGSASVSDAIDTQAGIDYWERTSADENGMLGGVPSWKGFEAISRIDLQGSRMFLARLGIGTRRERQRVRSAVDAGAGIGRITKGLLLDLSDQVDIVEPIAKFTASLHGHAGIRTVFNVGLQDWNPPSGAEYDLIWTQWCLGHLRDGEVVAYLRTCAAALRPGSGVIVVKENMSTSGRDVFDETDSSVTRQDASFRTLFEKAGLHMVETDEQRGLPEVPPLRLFPVRMYALRPKVLT